MKNYENYEPDWYDYSEEDWELLEEYDSWYDDDSAHTKHNKRDDAKNQ